MRILVIVTSAAILAGCAYPRSSASEGAPPGHVLVKAGPIGATVILDGRSVGVRTSPKGDTFDVEGGRHVVETMTNGSTVIRREVFVEPGTTVTISGEQ